jgi:DNA-nicking Smr family endonuclease
MKKESNLSNDDIALFRSEINGSNQLNQDTVHFKKKSRISAASL